MPISSKSSDTQLKINYNQQRQTPPQENENNNYSSDPYDSQRKLNNGYDYEQESDQYNDQQTSYYETRTNNSISARTK